MHASPSVLVVDRSEETREVLETVLEKRGIRTFTASRVNHGAEMARSQQPDLIVLDLEVDGSGPDVLCAKFRGSADSEEPRLVLLGSMVEREAIPRGEIVAKPYHYGPLIRRIEEILGTADRDSREAA